MLARAVILAFGASKGTIAGLRAAVSFLNNVITRLNSWLYVLESDTAKLHIASQVAKLDTDEEAAWETADAYQSRATDLYEAAQALSKRIAAARVELAAKLPKDPS